MRKVEDTHRLVRGDDGEMRSVWEAEGPQGRVRFWLTDKGGSAAVHVRATENRPGEAPGEARLGIELSYQDLALLVQEGTRILGRQPDRY